MDGKRISEKINWRNCNSHTESIIANKISKTLHRGTTDSLKYRMCLKMDENVSYMLSEGNELVQNEYKNELVQNEYKNELVQKEYKNELVQSEYKNELVENEYKNELVQNEYKNLRHDKVATLLNW